MYDAGSTVIADDKAMYNCGLSLLDRTIVVLCSLFLYTCIIYSQYWMRFLAVASQPKATLYFSNATYTARTCVCTCTLLDYCARNLGARDFCIVIVLLYHLLISSGQLF